MCVHYYQTKKKYDEIATNKKKERISKNGVRALFGCREKEMNAKHVMA